MKKILDDLGVLVPLLALLSRGRGGERLGVPRSGHDDDHHSPSPRVLETSDAMLSAMLAFSPWILSTTIKGP